MPAAIATAFAIPTTSTGEGASVVVPSPNPPSLLSPQQFTCPVARSAHVWSPPALTATASPMPSTSTGVVDDDVVPSPSCPEKPRPQHLIDRLASSAHECASPALTPTTSVSPSTETGAIEYVSAVTAPSCPDVLSPQHDTVPPANTTQVWASPAAISPGDPPVAVLPEGASPATGESRLP